MRTAKQAASPTAINLFAASKPVRFLESLKQLRFSGQLVFTSSQEQQWLFYLYPGSIAYATGGVHPVRRWHRNLAAYCPQIPVRSLALQRELANSEESDICWEYQLLRLWVEKQTIAPEQAAKMIRAAIAEVLFDVAQAMQVTCQITPDNSLSAPLVAIDMKDAIAEAHQHWQVWRQANLANYSFNSAPIIKQPEKLRQQTSAQVYQSLTQILNRQRTLRDLAALMKRDVVQVTRSLLPYIQSGLVELINIPDLPAPVGTSVPETPVTAAMDSTSPLIACVDDSPLICQTMKTLLTAAGYRFISVEDGLRAFAILLAHKPDVIFLDLVMPNTNGYEICAQLRKLSCFQNTPIVILTGNDGIVDRVRAKLIGASDFINKPIDAGTVLSVIHKHLEQGAISH